MPTPNTPLTAWNAPLRAILGDEDDGYGVFRYPDDVLASALRAVFAVGKAPAGAELRTEADAAATFAALGDATNVHPTLPVGSAIFGELLVRAALILINPDDGRLAIVTRPMSVREDGDRKAAITDWLLSELADIESGSTFAFNPATFDQLLESR